MKKKSLIIVALSVVLAFGLAGVAAAQEINIFDGFCENDLASFFGSIEYTSIDDTTGTFVVNLTNDNGGSLTAFAFNNPDNLITDVTLATTLTEFDTLLGGDSVPPFQDGISAPPPAIFGFFDIGAGTTDDWLSGTVADGLQSGESGTWTFNLTGTNMDTLTTLSFVEELENGNFFVVRAQGFPEPPTAGSDKCSAVVPIPPSALLMGSGLLGLGLVGVRRKSLFVK